MSDVTPASGVLLSVAAAREVAGALELLGRLAAPRGQQLSPRLRAIYRELLTSAARDRAAVGVRADGVVGQPVSYWESSVVDTVTAARMLGITPGGVTWLCRNGRLTATRVGGRWLVDTASLRIYQTIREER